VHDSWARHYDFVYDECFGGAFWRLTADTLDAIRGVQPPPARVLDLGAGTGRLAIPLALLGYDVTAIEGSPAMAAVLASKALDVGARLTLRQCRFEALAAPSAEAPPADAWDLALAVFTVLNYVLADDELAALARAIASRLRPDGHFVFDIAERRLFASALFESPDLHREVAVRQLAPALFAHRDTAVGIRAGERFHYDETFTFRYWREEEVLAVFAAAGLDLHATLTDRLAASGSRWFVLRRAGAPAS
jgi:SAM-dependent methyltransferase